MAETSDSSRMQGKRKRKRRAIAKQKRVDRISGLPEEVLHILSFITTRQAVHMSLLSKRWRHLWTSIPALYFEDIEFSDFEKCEDFIDKVFIRRRQDMNIWRVNFLFHTRVDRKCVLDWIIHAIRGRNIQELVIESKTYNYGECMLPNYGEFKLPRGLFSCGSLRVLKSNMGYCALKLPDDFKLSELKSLYLYGIESEGNSLGRLISNSPFLEDLYLECCSFESIRISGEQLKKLSIIDSDTWDVGNFKSKIQVSAPNLRSLKYYPFAIQQNCSLENLVSLVEADIIIKKQAGGTGEIFEGISNVSILNLTFANDEGLHLLPELLGNLPMFQNLTNLKLNAWLINDHVQTIIYIVQHSPNLNSLIINNERPFYTNWHKKKQHQCIATRKERSPQFLLKLKEIEIKNFESSAIQRKLLTFLMSNSQNLKRVAIDLCLTEQRRPYKIR